MTTAVQSAAMVGRSADLAWLDELLDEVRSGVPRTAVIGGEAGIGKTRLLGEFRAGLRPDVRLISGQCVDLGDVAAPYTPVKAALRTLVAEIGPERALEAVGPGAAALVALLPELGASIAGVGPVEPAAGSVAGAQLHEAIAVLLETVARETPTVLVVEDLHWVDAASLALLRFLVRSLGSSRVLVVLTYRTEDVTRGHPARSFLSELERDRGVARRELVRLTRSQVRKLARSLLGEAPTDAVVDTVFRRSDGVPFFVEELMGLDGCRDEGELPDTLRDLLLARYERLSEGAQQLLRLIATHGVRITHQMFAAVSADEPGGAERLELAAREAVTAGVLVIDGDDYLFRHALVREAIFDDLLPGERARYHARYAEAYEAMAAAGTRRLAAVISSHWLGAHDAERAFPATIQAMHEARRATAFATAAQLGERALGLWDVVRDPAAVAGMSRVELMSRTATYLGNTGEIERRLALVKAALDESPRDDANLPRLLRDKAGALAALGRPGSIELLEEALDVLGPDGPAEMRASVLVTLAGRLMIEGRLDESAVTADAAAALALEIGARRIASVAVNIAAECRANRGQVELGLAELERAHELAGDDGHALLRYWVNASDLYFLLGEHERAVALAEEGLERARAQGLERSSGVILASNAVDPLFALGEWARAEALIERGLALAPTSTFRVYLLRARVWAMLWRGDPAGAESVLRAARAQMHTVGAVEMQTRLAVGRVAVELALERGDLVGAWREALPLLDEPLVPLPGYAYPYAWAVARTIAAARAVDPEGAARLDGATSAAYEGEVRLRALLARLDAWPTAPIWRSFIEAELASGAEPAGGEGAGGEGAVARWRSAVEAADDRRAPGFLRPYALQRLGEAELAAGERLPARATLRAAWDAAVAGGVGLVQTRVADIARAGGLALELGGGAGTGAGRAGAPSEPVADLTARERQVLDLIAEGLSNRQIGERLFISGKTASVHVSAILRKLGAATRTEAVFRAGH